jgi:hypothetical protein
MPTTSNNCTVSIQHNINVGCVRAIKYCLNENDTDVYCNTANDSDIFMFEYLSNFTSNISIVYDMIYAKYQFNFNILQCTEYGKK